MALQTTVISGVISQGDWDAKLDSTTKTTDDLDEGSTNKYFNGKSTDDLSEGSSNKYDVDHFTGKTQDDLGDGTTNKQYSSDDKTKLGTVEESATIDQTGAEIRDSIVSLGDTERKILITSPETSEFKIIGIHRNAAGEVEYIYDDEAES